VKLIRTLKQNFYDALLAIRELTIATNNHATAITEQQAASHRDAQALAAILLAVESHLNYLRQAERETLQRSGRRYEFGNPELGK
jgi:hypothetical protein